MDALFMDASSTILQERQRSLRVETGAEVVPPDDLEQYVDVDPEEGDAGAPEDRKAAAGLHLELISPPEPMELQMELRCRR